MKLLLFHVSDIHLSTQRYTDNHILYRCPEILSAVYSMFLTQQKIGAVVMLVAGDIAYAGRRDQYALALTFFKSIQAGLSGEQNDYIEGRVLQENCDPTNSSFNVVMIDFDEVEQALYHFEWRGKLCL